MRHDPSQFVVPFKIRMVTSQSMLACTYLSATIRVTWGTRWGTRLPKLTALDVKKAKPGIHPDGDGLYLCVSPAGKRTWVYRFSWRGTRPEMGLGSFDQKTELSDARNARDEARRDLKTDRNPIEARRERRRAAAPKPTFGKVADELFAAKAIEWGNAKHRDQWKWSLTAGAADLRLRSVDEIDTEAVLSVLKPIWTTKPETASRLRGRIEAVLDAAKAQGYRSGRESRCMAWASFSPASEASEGDTRPPRRDELS